MISTSLKYWPVSFELRITLWSSSCLQRIWRAQPVMLLYVTLVYVARGRYVIQVIYALLFYLSTLELVRLC